jgi:hypothetical protein
MKSLPFKLRIRQQSRRAGPGGRKPNSLAARLVDATPPVREEDLELELGNRVSILSRKVSSRSRRSQMAYSRLSKSDETD